MRGRKVWLVSAAVGLAASGIVIAAAGPAGATNVSTEAALRAAFGDPAETKIDLDADISLSDCSEGAADVTRTGDADLILDGHGHTITQTCDNRVFEIDGAAVTVQNITITGGDASFNTTKVGGGIAHFGPGLLSVVDSVITGNHGGEGGGGLFGDGGIKVTNSTISENDADYNSAADSELTITIVGSSITNNKSSSAPDINAAGTVGSTGALTIQSSSVTNNVNPVRNALGSGESVNVINSTVVGNAPAQGLGGAAVRLVYSTIVDNGGNDGAANIGADALTSFASVVALPRGGRANCSKSGATSNGFNFSDDASCGFTNATQKDRETAGDPALGALANNGGKSETRKPSDTSPLKDAIPPDLCQIDAAAGVTADQVGTARPQGAGCEIGAFEIAVAAPTSATAPPEATVVEVASLSSAKSSSGGAPIALIVLAVLVIGGIVIALLIRRRRSDDAA